MPFDYLASNVVALYVTTLILGLLVGSFLNVVIYRLPVMMQQQWERQCAELADPDNQQTVESPKPFNLTQPGSHCPACNRPVKPLENVPVLSYLFLKGKCAGCGTSISLRYPVIETITGLLSLVVVWHFGFSLQAVAGLALTWALIALTMIDYDHQLLPDDITLPFLWLGLLLGLFGIFVSLQASIIGAIAGYLSLWSVYMAFKLLTGKEGMGYGDFKLFALFGAWLGWKSLPVIILMSSLVGAVVGIALILLHGRDRNHAIPFGPFLAVAGWITLIWGDTIINKYLQISGIH